MNTRSRKSERSLHPLLLLLGLAVLAGLAWVAATPRKPMTAARMAEGMNRVTTLPRDMGDGLRLDRIGASGNDVVVTLTITDMPPPPYPADVLAEMKQAALSDVCREWNKDPGAKAALARAGIGMVREFRNPAGAVILSHRVTPDLC
jgi:hypothetical protein